MDIEAARLAGEATLGRLVCSISPVTGGANSRVLRLEMQDCVYAFKLYPPRGVDDRDRVNVEANAVVFLRNHDIRNVPSLIAADAARNCAVFSWIDGLPVIDPDESDVDEALLFLKAVHTARHSEAARLLPEAAEACLTASELARQVERRFARLMDVSGANVELAEFIGRAQSAFQSARHELYLGCRANDIDPTAKVTHATLSPSDFGFHNVLKSREGHLTFIDFEYFGWDDPVKLVSDIMLHPRNTLTAALRDRLEQGLLTIYGDDPEFHVRLRLCYPLYALRWCGIVLNEFLPEKWIVRAHAGAPEQVQAQSRQLAKAKALFDIWLKTNERLASAAN